MQPPRRRNRAPAANVRGGEPGWMRSWRSQALPATRVTGRRVVGFWLALTAAGTAAAGPAFRSFSAQYSVPGREGYETNQAITRLFGNGGDSAPVVAVVTLPAGTSAGSPVVARQLDRVESR